MLQFRTDKERDTKAFYFEGLKPGANPNDLLGEGWGGRRVQDFYDRGFLCCYADKLGTVKGQQKYPCNKYPCELFLDEKTVRLSCRRRCMHE